MNRILWKQILIGLTFTSGIVNAKIIEKMQRNDISLYGYFISSLSLKVNIIIVVRNYNNAIENDETDKMLL